MNDKKDLAKKGDKPNALQLLAARLNVSEEGLTNTLKKTAFRECKTNEEFMAAVIVANTYGLNPLLKEIYAFPGSKGGVVPVVGIDGWISLVNRHKTFDGCELIENENNDGILVSVTAKFYMKDKSHPIVITEYMDECCKKDKEPWKKYPRRMLRHKAYIQGARIAFGLSGIYDEDEAERIIETQAIDNPKAFVESPKSKTESKPQETTEKEIEFGGSPYSAPADDPEPPKQETNGYKEMLNKFQKAKEIIGKEEYYAILQNFGMKHANEVKVIFQGNQILDRMREGIS